jgi:hypothetical protein
MEIINDFEQRIANITFKEYWEEILQSSFLDDFDERGIQFLKEKLDITLTEGAKEDKETIHLFYSNFELEFNNFGESYKSILELVSKESNSIFNPTKIIEEHLSDGIKISFEYNKRKYECRLFLGRVCDANIFWIINKALREAKSKILIGVLFKGFEYQDDYLSLGLINPQKYAILRELSLVPDFDDDMFYSKKIKMNYSDFEVTGEDDD